MIYNKLLPRIDMRDGLTVRLDGPRGSHIIWGTADPVQGDGWSSAEFTNIERLLPHLRQYMRVRQALANAEALGSSLAGLLDNVGTAVILLVVDPGDRTNIDLERVGAVLGLTPAQSQVAVSLAQGKTIRDIAMETGRSQTTIRWHIRHIFAKHGLSRQVELVQLVVSLPFIRLA